jgi:hypothetical protein
MTLDHSCLCYALTNSGCGKQYKSKMNPNSTAPVPASRKTYRLTTDLPTTSNFNMQIIKALSLTALLAPLALAAPNPLVPGDVNTLGVIIDEYSQLVCQASRIPDLSPTLHDCNGHALTPEVCQERCTCVMGSVVCRNGWNKCSEDTMTQYCRCALAKNKETTCPRPNRPCYCKSL